MTNVRPEGTSGKRVYRSPARAAQARRTRAAVLDAARALFVERGYAATSIAAVATAAGVNPDTVYASVGPKPVLFRALMESAISGTADAVPADERDYVRAIAALPGAAAKLERMAQALASIQPRLAPLLQVAQSAPEVEEVWREINERRASNMRRFAADLMATGDLRADLSLDEVATTVWLLAGSDVFLRLTRDRRWSRSRYQRWLATTWQRQFLA